jgi:hypothetical protein
MSQIPSDPELKAIESALGELIPVSSRLDRDKLMYQAGAMSKPGPSRRWAWPAITAALCVALAGESLFLGARSSPRVVERIVFMPAPAAEVAISSEGATATNEADAPPARMVARAPGITNDDRARSVPFTFGLSSDASDYQRFRNLVILFGLDALPERAVVVASEDDREIEARAGLKPAGALRSVELERILKPGGPS